MKLNLGCGSTRYPGFTNVDVLRNDNVDVVWNLNSYTWPWEDGSIEEIIAEDVLEHLWETPLVINEMWRILDDDGIVTIQVPDVIRNPMSAFTDPTHVRYFTDNSFDYWDPATEFGKKYGYYYKNKFIIMDKTFPSGNIRITMKKEED